MANQVRVGTFIYRINPDNDKEMQRRSIGGNNWSRVAGFNGYHILDLLLADNDKDIEVYTDRYVYLAGIQREYQKKVGLFFEFFFQCYYNIITNNK